MRCVGTEGVVLGKGVPPNPAMPGTGAASSEKHRQNYEPGAPGPGWADAAAGSGRLSRETFLQEARRHRMGIAFEANEICV